ncbi:MAG: carbohydrate kinase, partial [Caldilineae bacterium]
GALFRALLEGVAMESRSALEPELAFAGLERPQAIVAVGGSVRSRLFMEIKAAVYNQAVTVVSVEEATALGAALLAGIGAGVFPDHEAAVAALNLERTVVAPDPGWVKRYETLYQEVYVHLYDALLPLHRRLHALFRQG